MINSKYNKVLTVILIIVVIVIFGLLGFWGYQTYVKYFQEKDLDTALNEFNESISRPGGIVRPSINTTTNESYDSNFVPIDNGIPNSTSNNGSSTPEVVTYKGFIMLGRMEIPKIDLDLPVLEKATKKSLEQSIGVLMGPGLNQVGNTLILGHNYRNGTFFSRNDELENGDSIYITDNSGTRIEYEVYNVYTTSSEDISYMSRDTAGRREISLSTCTDDSNYRLVVWAKEKE